jgi:hypothetical protein
VDQFYGQQIAPGVDPNWRPERPSQAPATPPPASGATPKNVAPQHACIMEAQLDVLAYKEQYMYRCRCHEGSFHIWQPDDALDKCPGGTPYPDPRTLIRDSE